MRNWFILLTLQISFLSIAQENFQKAFGTIIDAETNQGLSQANVNFYTSDSQTLIAQTLSDEKGNFSCVIPYFGRINVSVSVNGYENQTFSDLLISSSKDILVDFSLSPKINELGVVEVTPLLISKETINPMATVSAYRISPENMDRFAGSWEDPMRAITAYPGITAGSSRYNNFSVRGNPPIGTLYRLEGIPIHNPNHFAVIGSTGGFVTQFSSHLLATSNFYASAFPAEYGNATSAVFDFKFRKGNPNQYEHAFKAGILGFDFASEGPLSKNHKASYLINYRYSTLGVLARMINLGGVLPQYQDLSFNLNFPTEKAGTFKVFGIGGLSSFNLAVEKDSSKWEPDTRRVERNYGSNSGAFGLTHIIKVSPKGYWHSVAAVSSGEYFDKSDYLEDNLSWTPRENARYTDRRYTFTSDYNHAFGRRHSNKTGVIVTHIQHSFTDQKYNRLIGGIDTLTNTSGSTQTYQIFTQSKFRLNEKLTLTAGVHGLYFGLNNNYSIEPRAGLNYSISSRTNLSFGYGLHSRVEDLSIYFLSQTDSNGVVSSPNQNLGFMKSHQAVISFSQVLFKDHRLSIETYYQYSNNIPGELNGTTTVQNLFYTYSIHPMQNIGEAKNMGIEMMLEKYGKSGMYYIISIAAFDSKYKGGDGEWRNTEYNQQYALNLLMGKEYRLKQKKDNERLLGINFNYHHSGGSWQTPIDSVASKALGWTQYDLSNPYSVKQPMLYNLDFSLTFKRIRPHVTGEFAFSIKNVINKRIAISQYYDYKIDEIVAVKDYGMIPVISYKLTF